MISYPLQVAGKSTRVLEAGDIGPVIVLIHGVTSHAGRWQLMNIDPLADAGYHVVAFDLPGHGFATKGANLDYSVPGYSTFLRQFLDVIRVERATFVGASFGGHIAAYFASQAPARADSIVLVGSTGLEPLGKAKLQELQEAFSDMSREAIRQRRLNAVVNGRSVTEESIEEDMRINNSFGAAEAFERLGAYFREGGPDRDVVNLADLDAAGVPLFLMWGTEDRTVPVSAAEAAHAAVADSKLLLMPGTAHSPYAENPGEFIEALLQFLKEQAFQTGR